MPRKVLTNKIGQDPNDPSYRSQLEELKQSMREGSRPHVYLRHQDGSEYYTDLVAGRILEDRINAVLPLRPFLNSSAEAVASNGFFGGSIDTLGTYVYAPYRLGEDTLKKMSEDKEFSAIAERDYIITWYVD